MRKTLSELNITLDLETNPYYNNNKDMFNKLVDLICEHPRGYALKLNAKGRKREPDIIPLYFYLNQWINTVTSEKLSNPIITTPTKCYWILHGLTDFPKCAYCGKQDYYEIYNVHLFNGYPKYCSLSCIQNSEEVKMQRELTNLDRRGVKNPFLSEEVKSLIFTTKLELHGDGNFRNSEKAVLTKKDKAEKDPNYTKTIVEKTRLTVRENYGVNNVMQDPDIKSRCIKAAQDTLLLKYDVKSALSLPWVLEKCEKTNLKRYKVRRPCLNNEIRRKAQLQYTYDNQNFDSLPELAMYIWLQDNNMNFEYLPDITYEFVHNNITHYYSPDFIVDSIVYEIKGSLFLKNDGTWQCPYDHKQDSLYESKHLCAINNGVVILYADLYERFISYVEHKYGKNYLSLFRNKLNKQK